MRASASRWQQPVQPAAPADWRPGVEPQRHRAGDRNQGRKQVAPLRLHKGQVIAQEQDQGADGRRQEDKRLLPAGSVPLAFHPGQHEAQDYDQHKEGQGCIDPTIHNDAHPAELPPEALERSDDELAQSRSGSQIGHPIDGA